MTELHYRLPNEVAGKLQVSPSTLHRWSSEFTDFLSSAAGQASHRRYTDDDVETLVRVKDLLGEGMTYTQVGKWLEALRARQAAAGSDDIRTDAMPLAVLSQPLPDRGTVAPVVSVLANTLHTVAEGQQLLLGSQQANRDLLSVVVQDNFSLKEENAKLRDRMLELERDLAELRRMNSIHLEALEARLQQLEEHIRRRRFAARPPERTGWLDGLFDLFG